MTPTAATAVPGRRERKKQATRNEIKRAALALAQQDGVDALTVEAISEAADVSPRTFFNYFSCKEDALISDSTETAAALCTAITARPAGEAPLRALRAAFADSGVVATLQYHREEALARHRLATEHPSLLPRQLAQYAALQDAVAAAVGERLGVDPGKDLRPALFASLAITVVRVTVRQLADDGSKCLDQLFEDAFDLLEGELR